MHKYAVVISRESEGKTPVNFLHKQKAYRKPGVCHRINYELFVICAPVKTTEKPQEPEVASCYCKC